MRKLGQGLRAMARDERGQILPTVLVLLILGALLIIPALKYGSTSLKANQVTEKKAMELYAADSGVTDAVFWLQEDGETAGRWESDVPEPGEEGAWIRSDYSLNDKTVGVRIADLGGNTYKVTSTATTTSPEGGSTTIESFVVLAYSDFGFLLDNAITSLGSVTIKPGSTVNGTVQLPNADDLDNKGTINGTIIEDTATFPTGEQLCELYWDQVKDLGPPSPYADGAVIEISSTDPNDPDVIGPLWAEGDLLTIDGTGWGQPGGTIYVKGDLVINPNPSMSIDMNGQTIFAEGTIDIRPGVTLSGSGCVIAVGDVFFNPDIAAGSENDFILVMSAEGTVHLNPKGAFYGAIVGDADVDLWSGGTINWVDPTGKDLNFPQGEGSTGDPGTTVTVATYSIS